jgi:hypothetical protein
MCSGVSASLFESAAKEHGHFGAGGSYRQLPGFWQTGNSIAVPLTNTELLRNTAFLLSRLLQRVTHILQKSKAAIALNDIYLSSYLLDLILECQHGTFFSRICVPVGPFVPATLYEESVAYATAQYVLWNPRPSTIFGQNSPTRENWDNLGSQRGFKMGTAS